jgi:hypothetical protein
VRQDELHVQDAGFGPLASCGCTGMRCGRIHRVYPIRNRERAECWLGFQLSILLAVSLNLVLGLDWCLGIVLKSSAIVIEAPYATLSRESF